MPIGKPRPTGAVGSSSSHKKNIWSNIAEAQLPKSNYEYRRLVGNQIRILRLHAAESSTDTIECSLEVHDTDELSNHYNALSYTWGNEDAIQKILLRAPQEPTTGTGKARFQAFAQKMTKTRFYIRPNLEDALRQFRDTNPNTQQDLLLWIDAICINQIDEEEKSMQVARMAEIYSKAEDVLIWLGKEYNASSTAMEFIPKILDLEQSDALISKESNRKQWTALADLMRREWFNRRWVVQELVLAKDRYLYCGDRSLHWSDFERAVSFFTNKLDNILAMFTNSAELRHNAKILADIRALGATALVNITNEFFRWSEGGSLERLNTLESLVARLPMFESTDPRDIIYSLLSIAEDTQNCTVSSARKQDELRKRGLVPFEADYKKGILEVFKDFTAFCIQTSGSLDIICRHWAPSQFRNPGILHRMKTRAENERTQADPFPSDFSSDEEFSLMMKVHLPSWIGLLSESPYGVPDVGRSAGESLVRSPNDAGQRYNASKGYDADVLFGETDALRNQGTFKELVLYD